jgi:hypothetical protein
MADSARATKNDLLSYESTLISIATEVVRRDQRKYSLEKLKIFTDDTKRLLKLAEEDDKIAYFNFKTNDVSFSNESGCKTVNSILALMPKIFSTDCNSKAICFLLTGNINSSIKALKE